MSSCKVIVFVKNKLITLDTVLPILLELKVKYDVSSDIVVFDKLAHDAINSNIVIKDVINYIGKEVYVTNGEKIKFLRRTYVLFGLFRILFDLINGAKVIHFGHLNKWPLKFIALIFYNSTFQLQSTAYDFEYVTSKIKYQNLNIVSPVGRNVVFFAKNINNKILSNISDRKKVYKFGETRTRELWVEYVHKKSNYYFDLCHRNIDYSRGVIVFILGTILGYKSQLSLFQSTVRALVKESGGVPILIKPHAYTEMEVVNKEINGHENIYLTYLHPSILSTRAVLFISNNFSNTLADAHSFGVKTIEYSKYSSDLSRFTKDGLSLSNNESIDPQYVDYFINNDEKKLSYILKKILLDNYHPSTFNGYTSKDDELLKDLSCLN
ncbi:hypothetical protein HOL24_05180 [bacterium]|nr:hypothetical protein [bacterium]